MEKSVILKWRKMINQIVKIFANPILASTGLIATISKTDSNVGAALQVLACNWKIDASSFFFYEITFDRIYRERSEMYGGKRPLQTESMFPWSLLHHRLERETSSLCLRSVSGRYFPNILFIDKSNWTKRFHLFILRHDWKWWAMCKDRPLWIKPMPFGNCLYFHAWKRNFWMWALLQGPYRNRKSLQA